MNFAGFESVLDAAIYRKNHGGWLFVPDSTATIAGPAVWFSPEFTPARIMLHPICKGNGALICDNRFIKG